MVQPTSCATARASRSLAPSLSPHSSAGFLGADSGPRTVLRRSFVCNTLSSKGASNKPLPLKAAGDSTLKEVAKCSQRLKTVANYFSDCQHGHREDHARNTPHPEPENERDDDEDRI